MLNEINKPNMIERIQMVKAMEFVARNLNDEELFYYNWLTNGVADGDIRYGDLSVQLNDLDHLDCYISDKEFAELMDLFLYIMHRAYKEDSGLYCNWILSDAPEQE